MLFTLIAFIFTYIFKSNKYIDDFIRIIQDYLRSEKPIKFTTDLAKKEDFQLSKMDSCETRWGKKISSLEYIRNKWASFKTFFLENTIPPM